MVHIITTVPFLHEPNCYAPKSSMAIPVPLIVASSGLSTVLLEVRKAKRKYTPFGERLTVDVVVERAPANAGTIKTKNMNRRRE